MSATSTTVSVRSLVEAEDAAVREYVKAHDPHWFRSPRLVAARERWLAVMPEHVSGRLAHHIRWQLGMYDLDTFEAVAELLELAIDRAQLQAAGR